MAKRISFRIQFDPEDVQFMEDYRESVGTPIQVFVATSVKDRIAKLRIEQFLNEKELID